ncbi:MAG TPA: hypothetical protein VMW48_03550, partial [Vicinamibacterales bacterium]|nr:hypothetical protein [Vicinamibacterales bacterium]
ITNAETAAEAMAVGVTKFGSRAGPDMVAAIREGRFEFADFTEELKEGDETIATATEDTEGFGEQFKKLKNQIQVAVGPIVEDFAGIASSMGNLIYLLPALTGALGRGLGKALPAMVKRSSGLIRGAGTSMGRTLGTAAAGAFAVVMVAKAFDVFGEIRDGLRQQTSGIVSDIDEIISTGTDAQLLAAQRELEEGIGNLDAVKDLGIFTNEIRDQLNTALDKAEAQIKARGIKISDTAAKALAMPPLDTANLTDYVNQTFRMSDFISGRTPEDMAQIWHLQAVELEDLTGLTYDQAMALTMTAESEDDLLAKTTAAIEAENQRRAGLVAGAKAWDVLTTTGRELVDSQGNLIVTTDGVGESAEQAAARMGLLNAAIKTAREQADAIAGTRGMGKINDLLEKQIRLRNQAAKDNDVHAFYRHQAKIDELQDEKDLLQQGKDGLKAFNKRKAREKAAIEEVATALGISRAKARVVWKENGKDVEAAIGDMGNLEDAVDDVPDKSSTTFTTPGLKTALANISALQTRLGSLYGKDIDIQVTSGGSGPSFFAAGGHITGPAIVGENGPELYVPDRPGMIYNQQQVAAMAGGETTVHHEHTITAEGAGNLRDAGYDEQSVADMLRSAVLGANTRYRWGT